MSPSLASHSPVCFRATMACHQNGILHKIMRPFKLMRERSLRRLNKSSGLDQTPQHDHRTQPYPSKEDVPGSSYTQTASPGHVAANMDLLKCKGVQRFHFVAVCLPCSPLADCS